MSTEHLRPDAARLYGDDEMNWQPVPYRPATAADREAERKRYMAAADILRLGIARREMQLENPAMHTRMAEISLSAAEVVVETPVVEITLPLPPTSLPASVNAQ